MDFAELPGCSSWSWGLAGRGIARAACQWRRIGATRTRKMEDWITNRIVCNVLCGGLIDDCPSLLCQREEKSFEKNVTGG